MAMPAYNEDGIAEFVAEVWDHLVDHVHDLAFVVVDDCSPEVSARERLSATQGHRVTVHDNPRNLGHGPTVMRAYAEALLLEPDVVIGVDGDGQFHGADFVRLLAHLHASDVVVACREQRSDPWYRRLLTSTLSTFLGPWTSGVADTNSPLRAYRAPALAALLDQVGPDSAVPHLRMSLAFRRLPLRVATVTVRARPRLGESETGTSWGEARRVVPPRSLVRFCVRAARELVATGGRPSGVAPSGRTEARAQGSRAA